MSDGEYLTESLLDVIGKSAVCFLGAGFSLGAKDKSGNQVPDTESLCNEIKTLASINIKENASLSDLADYCQNNKLLKGKLNQLLINRLTLCEPTENQKTILSLPWRCIFTTNFDDITEVSIKDRKIQTVTPVKNTYSIDADALPVYYLHGRAQDILEGSADPGIVLSERNYLKLRERNHNLLATLENEVHTASRIFFVGYSIRDAEIAGLIFNINNISEKSIVISSDDIGQIAKSRLEKFGKVCNIGVNGLAKAIKDIKSRINYDDSECPLRFVTEIKPESAKPEVSVNDVDSLILTGQFSYSAFASQMQSSDAQNIYCVERKEKIEQIFDSFYEGINKFFVSSDLGNGKTIFLNQIAYFAHRHGFDVYEINTQMPEIFSELDQLLRSHRRILFIIDGDVRYRRVAAYVGRRLPGNSLIVVSLTSEVDHLTFSKLADEIGGAAREIDINALNDREIDQWNKILERWGYWEEKIEDNASERVKYLKIDCNSEVRAIVLSMFETSKLGKDIDEMTNYFVKHNSEFEIPFIAVLMNALCHNHVVWERVVDWLHIDIHNFKNAILTSPISRLVESDRSWYLFSSSVLADYIFHNFEFDVEKIVDVYSKIVRETAYCADDVRSGFDARENLKELMRFRFLTRILSKHANGPKIINAIYHRLSNVPRIRENDQFWLQYSMARMENFELDSAEKFINTALGLAKKKGVDYSKNQILDQRARLLFLKNSLIGARVSKKEILTAIADLVKLLNETGASVIHPLRASFFILEFLENKCDEINSDEDIVEGLQNLVELMKSKLPSNGFLEKSRRGETKRISKNLYNIGIILANV